MEVRFTRNGRFKSGDDWRCRIAERQVIARTLVNESAPTLTTGRRMVRPTNGPARVIRPTNQIALRRSGRLIVWIDLAKPAGYETAPRGGEEHARGGEEDSVERGYESEKGAKENQTRCPFEPQSGMENFCGRHL